MKSPIAWSTEQREWLDAFLSAPQRPPYTMNIDQLDGFVRAICCGPGVTRLDEWQPLLFNGQAFSGQEPTIDTGDEAAKLAECLLALFSHHADEVAQGICSLPFVPTYTVDPGERQGCEQWCRGFLQGYIFWEEFWLSLLGDFSDVDIDLPKALSDDPSFELGPLTEAFDAILYVINTLADSDFALQNGVEREHLPALFECLPQTVALSGKIGQALYHEELRLNGGFNPEVVEVAEGDSPVAEDRSKGAGPERSDPERSGPDNSDSAPSD